MYIYIFIIQKITDISMLFTNWPIHFIIFNNTIIFIITNINISIFSLTNTIIIIIIINIIPLRYYYYQNQYLFLHYNFFMKNLNILKIFHSKITEKIAFRKPMFQSRITIFSTTIRTPIRIVVIKTYWRLWQHEHRIYIHIWQEVPIGN